VVGGTVQILRNQSDYKSTFGGPMLMAQLNKQMNSSDLWMNLIGIISVIELTSFQQQASPWFKRASSIHKLIYPA
jgi:hypothetical protein